MKDKNLTKAAELVCDAIEFIKGSGYDCLSFPELESLLEDYPELFSVKLKQNKNIGMIAAKNKLERIVLLALKNEEASLQQDDLGYNIGMYAATKKLESATIKALQNKKASIQQNCNGENIGMIVARHNLEHAMIIALQNSEAVEQRDSEGRNILDIIEGKNTYGIVKDDPYHKRALKEIKKIKNEMISEARNLLN